MKKILTSIKITAADFEKLATPLETAKIKPGTLYANGSWQSSAIHASSDDEAQEILSRTYKPARYRLELIGLKNSDRERWCYQIIPIGTSKNFSTEQL